MRRLRIWAALVALAVVAALVPAIAQAASGDPCEAAYKAPMNSTDKLKKYLDCRLDRVDQAHPQVTVTAPAPTVTVTAPASPGPTVTVTAPPEPSVTPAPTDTAPPAAAFPTRDTAGLPNGWVPKRAVTGEYRITTPGQVVEDVLITGGTIVVAAPNVTLRRIRAVNANVTNDSRGTCSPGLLIEDSELVASGATSDDDPPAVGVGSFTMRNTVIDGAPEGVRVGGAARGCGPVVVDQSFIGIAAPTHCTDWHGDGIQGYDGPALTVLNTTIVFTARSNCGGTAAFFYPSDQGNTSVNIDGLLVSGGGYPFRLGTPGRVRNLAVVDRSWGYGPIDVKCALVQEWAAQIVRLSPAGQPIPIRMLAC